MESLRPCRMASASASAWLLLLWWSVARPTPGVLCQGWWETVVENAGISTMHAAVTHRGNVVLLDRTNIGDSQLPLPRGVCRNNPDDRANTNDCTAHSAIYTPGSNSVRPLFVFTDTWCSSGQFDASGQLVQTGGDAEGITKIRTLWPCAEDGKCDWVEETTSELKLGRWYASNQQLPDGSQAVVGGRNAFTIEYVPANGRGEYYLQFLVDTNSAQNDNLYPFVHLLPDSSLFIFANRDSILYNWRNNSVIKALPTIPDPAPRNYPSAGSSVLLPLVATGDAPTAFGEASVLICGGAAPGAFSNPRLLLAASKTCGRISPLAAKPAWAMEDMPQRRVMGDMVITPLGDVVILNGAARGSQGWGYAADPVTTPVLYIPADAPGTRFHNLTASDIPRLYHSTANLLPDGRILVAGSNTHQFYSFRGQFPTELRVEAFSPPYLAGARPLLALPATLGYGEKFVASVAYSGGDVYAKWQLNMASAPFVTHSFAMGQRMLKLGVVGAPVPAGAGKWKLASVAPPNAAVAPAGYYMTFAVANWVPSFASWVKIAPE